jgi:hypothetical protein
MNASDNPHPTKWSVVAAKTRAQRPSGKIPTACRDANVECIGLFEMLNRKFQAKAQARGEAEGEMTCGAHRPPWIARKKGRAGQPMAEARTKTI